MQLVEAGSSHTDWSLIVEAGHADEQAAGDALERLLRRYWPAVYAYIRSTGRDVHESADLTQGFVCDIIISRRLCAGADPHRGRFRTLLLTAVKNYLRQQHRHERRMLRSPQRQKPLKLNDSQLIVANLPPTPSHRTPDQAFCYQWTATLIRRVLDTVGAECLADGLDAHWTVFEHRVARPLLLGEPPTDYAELVGRLGLKDTSQARNMMVTVKRRFVAALYLEVGQTLSSPTEIDDELHQLLRDLEQPS